MELDDIQEALEALALNRTQLIYKLPPEIIAKILAFVALASGRDFKRATRAARVFAISASDSLFWMYLCQHYHENSEHLVLRYSGYCDLFMRRPQLRFDGVYVCSSHYYRQAEQQGGSWYQQLIEVTYYRYIRLYPDGKCQTLVTVKDPESVLPFQDATKGPVNTGQWRFDADKNLLALSMAMETGYVGYFAFKILSEGGPVHNKLKWRGFRIKKHDSEEWDTIPIEKEGNFYFKRVVEVNLEAEGGEGEDGTVDTALASQDGGTACA